MKFTRQGIMLLLSLFTRSIIRHYRQGSLRGRKKERPFPAAATMQFPETPAII